MSVQQKRDDLGKLLACLLVSRKGDSTVHELERDYRENEGRTIPYRDFGCISVLDFLRSIPDHVKLRPSNGTHLVFPVVSEKIKHVNDLVVRQKPAKKSCGSRRKTSKPSRYGPTVREPRPFIPNNVQKEIAIMLTREPNGVKKDHIVEYLQNSSAIAGTVNLTNVDDYLMSMSHIAYTRGNMVFLSRSLNVTSNTAQHNIRSPNQPEAGTSNNSKTPQPLMSVNSTPVTNSYPAGAEEDEDVFYDDEFGDEEIRFHYASMNNHKVENDNLPQQSSWTSLGQGPGRMSSAKFIERGAGSLKQMQSQPKPSTLPLGNNLNNETMSKLTDNAYYTEPSEQNHETYDTYASDDEELVDIINDRLKSRLQQLIQKHPHGIWCADLPQTYLDEYNVPLDYAELGFQSVCDLASQLASIFHLCRWDNRGDFILYDASKPVPTEVKKLASDGQHSDWADTFDDDYEDVDPIPPALDLQVSQKLIPHDVMSHGESVGQERIPEPPSDGSLHHLEVVVSEVYTPSLFWVHLRKKRMKLGQLMENIHEFYQREGSNYTIPSVVVEKGLNCVCMFEDKWHRAIIKTVKPDGDVTLVFYDYGTTKTYPPEDVRFLHRLFSNLPAQSIPCGLYNIKPVKHDAWTRGASSDFWEKVADIPLVAIVNKIDRENNSMLISLVDTREEADDHINDWMVHKGLAEFGSMVRNRPSNYVFRHYVKCINYHYDKHVKAKERGQLNQQASNKHVVHPESESNSNSNSELKLKSADCVKSLMTKFSKYKKGRNQNNISPGNDVNFEHNSTSEQSTANEKHCLPDNLALEMINSSPKSMNENRFSKIFKSKLDSMCAAKTNIEIVEHSSTATSSVEQRTHGSDCNGHCNDYKVSSEDCKNAKHEPNSDKVKYFGSFQSFFGGHGLADDVDWSKIRTAVKTEQGIKPVARAKASAIPEFPFFNLREEGTGESAICQRSDKSSDDIQKGSVPHKYVTNFKEVIVEPVDKFPVKQILPAKDYFLNAIKSNNDHYYSAHGEKLWWSPDGNIENKAGVITPLLRMRRKRFEESDIDLMKVSASPEILQILRGRDLKSKSRGAASENTSDADLNFIIQLKNMGHHCSSDISDLSKPENKLETNEILTPKDGVINQSSLVIKSSACQTNLNKSAGSITALQNTNQSCTTSNSLPKNRFSTMFAYLNSKKKKNVPSVSRQNLSSESSEETVGTNSISIAPTSSSMDLTDSVDSSEKIIGLPKARDVSCEGELYLTKQFAKASISSRNQVSPTMHGIIPNTNINISDIPSTNIECSHELDERSEKKCKAEDSGQNDEISNLDLTRKNDDEISLSNNRLVRDNLTESTSSNITACNKQDVNVLDSLDICYQTSNPTQKQKESHASICQGTSFISNTSLVSTFETKEQVDNSVELQGHSSNTSELDSDDLSRSYSNSENDSPSVIRTKIDIELDKNFDTETLDNDEIIASRQNDLSRDAEDIQVQITPDNTFIQSGDNKIDTCVPKTKTQVYVPIVNDMDDLEDRDEWEVNGVWQDFMKGQDNYMSRIMHKLERAIINPDSAKISEITDNSEVADVCNSNYLRDKPNVEKITEKIYEKQYGENYVSKDNQIKPNDNISDNSKLLENNVLKPEKQSALIVDEKVPDSETQERIKRSDKFTYGNTLIRTSNNNNEKEPITSIPSSSGNQSPIPGDESTFDNASPIIHKSQKYEKSIVEIPHVKSLSGTSMEYQNHIPVATTCDNKIPTRSLTNKTMTMQAMLKNFKDKTSLRQFNTNSKQIEDSLQSKENTSENGKSGTSSIDDDTFEEIEKKESASDSEMFADLSNTSSSSKDSDFLVTNAISANVSNHSNDTYLRNKYGTLDRESKSCSSDDTESFDNELQRLPILSSIKKHRLTVKSCKTDDLQDKNITQINTDTVLNNDNLLSNESSSSNSSLSLSLFNKIKSMLEK
ncbi:uncharacterized protein LOC124178821 isoform X1 [Neodiprion fabricii]|uniref:uncharacterized protein LOC124178821 isoform X1 n=1 Tax=Neodiprion fabricii TaxID=2872261 RepID=UPI001ED983F2|nr:uncharacterized protein LOC124178821 isoform X1 [Neodiprion fabricii]